MTMKQYHDLLRAILEKGTKKSDRTGTGTISLFGYQMRFDLSDGFPLMTTKKLHLKSIIHELLWFLKGDTNIKYLKDNGVTIWDEWADENGDLGPVYGRQWRNFGAYYKAGYPMGSEWFDEINLPGVDQIKDLIEGLKKNPFSRRHIVSAWNPVDLPQMKLPPCHCLFQFNVRENEGTKFLDCQLYQRSADVFLGVPFNIASYSLLLMMVAQVVGMKAGCFVHTFGDVHLYLNHLDQVNTQLAREFRPLPTMKINPKVRDIFDFKFEDFELSNYNPWPTIKAQISV